MNIIYTPRLDLISLSPLFLEASLQGDLETLERLLGMPVPPDWLENKWVIQYRLNQLRDDPTQQPWLIRAMVLRDEGIMVGHVGFHTRPGEGYLDEYAPNGVEFGYTVYPAYRKRGYATEASVALMDWAKQQEPDVRFLLTIRPDNAPSLRIAQNFGFQKVGWHIDDIDGHEDIFLLPEAPRE